MLLVLSIYKNWRIIESAPMSILFDVLYAPISDFKSFKMFQKSSIYPFWVYFHKNVVAHNTTSTPIALHVACLQAKVKFGNPSL
jgi:hypothetical protein